MQRGIYCPRNPTIANPAVLHDAVAAPFQLVEARGGQ